MTTSPKIAIKKLVFAALLLLVSPASSEPGDHLDIYGLRGLKDFWILIERVDDATFEASQMDVTTIRANVLLDLFGAGVVAQDPIFEGDDINLKLPHLYIKVQAIYCGTVKGKPYYAAVTEMSLQQRVKLDRDTSLSVLGRTWEKSFVVAGVRSEVETSIQRGLKELAQAFAAEYLRWNPERRVDPYS